MNFSEQMLFCTAKIEGVIGGTKGSTATGFLFQYEEEVYLVTNKHVAAPGFKGEAVFIASTNNYGLSPEYGRTVQLPLTWNDFIGHPTKEIDVTVAQVSHFLKSNQPFIHSFGPELTPTSRQDKNKILPQDEVYFVGYPKGIWDSVNIMPVTRRGIIATHFDLDYQGIPSFLIDGAVYEGSSGSPVFVFKRPPSTGRDLLPISTEELFFVGILAAYRSSIDAINISSGQEFVFKTYLNLGTVFKWNTIIQAIKEFKRHNDTKE